jgi:hypothetical protein
MLQRISSPLSCRHFRHGSSRHASRVVLERSAALSVASMRAGLLSTAGSARRRQRSGRYSTWSTDNSHHGPLGGAHNGPPSGGSAEALEGGNSARSRSLPATAFAHNCSLLSRSIAAVLCSLPMPGCRYSDCATKGTIRRTAGLLSWTSHAAEVGGPRPACSALCPRSKLQA